MTQLQLGLEYPVYTHYTIELRHGEMPDLAVVRSIKAPDVDSAIELIEGLRDFAAHRHEVTWQDGGEMSQEGILFGLVDGEVWQIICVPPLAQELSHDAR